MRFLGVTLLMLSLLPLAVPVGATPTVVSESDRVTCQPTATAVDPACMVYSEHEVVLDTADCVTDAATGLFEGCFILHRCSSWVATAGFHEPVTLYNYCGTVHRGACVYLHACRIDSEDRPYLRAGTCYTYWNWAQAFTAWHHGPTADPDDISVCVDATTGPYVP